MAEKKRTNSLKEGFTTRVPLDGTSENFRIYSNCGFGTLLFDSISMYCFYDSCTRLVHSRISMLL